LNIIRKDIDGQIKYVFIDENMEYLNGSEAVQIIRKLEEKRKIKRYQIASISAFYDVYTKSRIINSGVNTIIPKPKNIKAKF
jgi:CheY-like chemotaxis protein